MELPRDALARAVEDGVMASPRAQDLGTRVPTDRWTVLVADRDGVSYGRSSRQVNRATVTTRLTGPRTFPPHHVR